MNEGTQRAPESPRIMAEIYRSLGSIESTVTLQGQKIEMLHKAMFIGNGRKSIFDILVEHDAKIKRLMGRDINLRKHSFKVAGLSSVGVSILYLTLKLIIYSITKQWPNVP